MLGRVDSQWGNTSYFRDLEPEDWKDVADSCTVFINMW